MKKEYTIRLFVSNKNELRETCIFLEAIGAFSALYDVS